MSYEKEYRVIDQLLEGTTRPTSPFTAKTGASMLDTLFERATHIPLWILSLGNEVVTIEELEAKMTKLGRQTRAIAIKYQHLPAVPTEEKKRENREFLVVGWDPRASLLQVGPSGSPTQDLAAQSLRSDGGPERTLAFSEQDASGGRGPIPELDGGLDSPGAFVGEVSLDGNREGRNVSHGATVAWNGRRSQG